MQDESFLKFSYFLIFINQCYYNNHIKRYKKDSSFQHHMVPQDNTAKQPVQATQQGQSAQSGRQDRDVISLMETVVLVGPGGQKEVNARIDTGAHTSSIDVKLAAELNLGPIIETKNVRSASGIGLRPLIRANITIKGKSMESLFTIANRDHMKYSVLVGRNILREAGFLIDPSVGGQDEE